MDNTIARQVMAENGGKWQIMVEKSSPRLFGRKWCFRVFPVVAIEVAGQAMAENGRKWPKMVEKSSPRLFGRKWIFACFTPFPYYYHFIHIHSILSIIVDKDSRNALRPKVMDCRLGSTNHSNIQYHFNTSNYK